MPHKWLGDNFVNELGWRMFDWLRSGDGQSGSDINLEDLYEKLKVEHRSDVEQAFNDLVNSSEKEKRQVGEQLLEWHQAWTEAGTENKYISVLADKYLMFLADNTEESITKTESGDEVETKREIERDVQAAREDFEKWLAETASNSKDEFEQRLEIIEDNPLEMFLRKVKVSYENFKETHDFSEKKDGAKAFTKRLVATLASIDYLPKITDKLESTNDLLESFRKRIEV